MRTPGLMMFVLATATLGCRHSQLPAPTRETPTASSPAGVRSSPPTTHADAELVADLERVIDELVRTDEFSGVVRLSRAGQPLLQRAYGLADRERQRPNTVDTPFALASVGKMFTAIAVAQLADQRLISFDTTIAALLPDYPRGEAGSRVTVHHLLTMSSGIPDVFRAPQFWADVPRIKAFSGFWPHFANAPLDFEPGTRGVYSNSNFLVLGAIAERVLGRPFIDIVEQQIFRPVGMTRTGYRSSDFPDAAVGYTRRSAGSGNRASGQAQPWIRAWDDPAASGATEGNNDEDCLPCTPMGGGYSTDGC